MPPLHTWDSSSLAYDAPGLTWDAVAANTQPHTTMDNRISATLSPADQASALTKLGEIQTLLPFLINLTAEEKSALPKMSAIRDQRPQGTHRRGACGSAGRERHQCDGCGH
jgi:hypothetical protein